MAADQQKPPGEAAAMVVDEQKLAEAAAARYPVAEVAEAVSFLNELTARLDAFPDVRDGLLDLLVGFGSSSGSGGDARAVASRAAALLAAHPDVLATFTAFLTGAAKAPADPPLAVTRPRRSTTRKSRSLPPPPEEEPGAHDPRSPPRKGGGMRDGDEPRVLEALAFLERVGEVAGREVWERFVEALDGAGGDRGMDAGEVYGGVRAALGPAHSGLLAEFAARFLPGKQEWEAEERRLARNRLRAEARAAAAAAVDQKQPRADDTGGGDRRQHGFQVTLEIVKKRRADDHHGAGDGDDYAPRVRTKKPRAAADGGRHRNTGTNGEPTAKNRSAARVVDAGDARGNGDRKPRRRGAPNGGGGSSAAAPPEASEERNLLFRRFRELWVFYTRYSTLVGTMARAEDLLLAGAGGDGEFPATVEKMFPRRESREFLASYYGGRWGTMRAALVEGGGGGGRAGAALKAVLESLRRKEAEAVAEEAEERRRQDAARAAERLAGLVRNRVRHEERRRRRNDAGDGGACPRR